MARMAVIAMSGAATSATCAPRSEELVRQGQFLGALALYTRPDGTQVARYRFTHSLYPSVLTDRVSAARRRS